MNFAWSEIQQEQHSIASWEDQIENSITFGKQGVWIVSSGPVIHRDTAVSDEPVWSADEKWIISLGLLAAADETYAAFYELGSRRNQEALLLLEDWYSTPDEKGNDYWDDLLQELASERLSLSTGGGFEY